MATFLLLPLWMWGVAAIPLIGLVGYAFAMSADYTDAAIRTGDQRRAAMAKVKVSVAPGLTRTTRCATWCSMMCLSDRDSVVSQGGVGGASAVPALVAGACVTLPCAV